LDPVLAPAAVAAVVLILYTINGLFHPLKTLALFMLVAGGLMGWTPAPEPATTSACADGSAVSHGEEQQLVPGLGLS
jgi:hypothetical protein